MANEVKIIKKTEYSCTFCNGKLQIVERDGVKRVECDKDPKHPLPSDIMMLRF